MADQESAKLNDRRDLLSGIQLGSAKVLSTTGAIFVALAVILLAIAVPIAMLVIGALKKDKCPPEPMIPIYLIVSGASSGVVIPLTIISSLCSKRNNQVGVGCFVVCMNILLFLISLFAICWFIAGNVWVFKNYKNRNFCDTTAYYLAFWSIITAYILSFMSCCSGLSIKKNSSSYEII